MRDFSGLDQRVETQETVQILYQFNNKKDVHLIQKCIVNCLHIQIT